MLTDEMTDLEISKALALAIGWPGAKYFDWLKSMIEGSKK